MSLKGLVQPPFAYLLTHPRRQASVHAWRDRLRRVQKRPHEVVWFHQVDDPYSWLLAQILPAFLKRYSITLTCHVVPPPPIETAPRLALLQAYGPGDCRELARYYGLVGPEVDRPDAEQILLANAALVDAAPETFLDVALDVGRRLWSGQALEGSQPNVGHVKRSLLAGRNVLETLGHYTGGMLYYEGEWYWGVDRIGRLEERLAALGVGGGASLKLSDVEEEVSDADTLRVYFSIRSPYSYLALARVFELAKKYAVTLDLRPVLPMVMRGLQVPRVKRFYLLLDASREAQRLGIPLGRVCDPLGAGVERVIAVYFKAQTLGKGEAFLISAGTGIWSEGIEVAQDSGLRKVVERCGLAWSDAQEALADEGWRARVEDNHRTLEEIGLWGVPSFKFGDYTVWGQDRLWLLERKLAARTRAVSS